MQQIPEGLKNKLLSLKELLDGDWTQDQLRQSRDEIVKEKEYSDFSIVNNMLARVAKELGEKELAIAHMQKSLDIDPANITAILLVASYYVQLADLDKAKKILELSEGLEIQTSDQARTIARLYVALGKSEDAVSFLGSVLNDNPNNAELRVARASLLLDLERSEECTLELKAALEQGITPACLKSIVNIIAFNLAAGDKFIALEALNSSLRVAPDQSRQSDNLLFLKSILMASLGDIKQSTDCISGVSSQLRPIANYAWCAVQVSSGNVAAASASIAAVIKGLSNSQYYHERPQIRQLVDELGSDPLDKLSQIQQAMARISEHTANLSVLLEL